MMLTKLLTFLTLLASTISTFAAAPQSIEPPTQPTTAPSTNPTRTLENLSRRWRQRVQADPRDFEAHFEWRILRMFADLPAVPGPRGLAAEDQQTLDTLIDGLSRFRTSVRANKDATLAEKIRPLLDMSDCLRDRANLALSNPAICTQVQQFGIYNPIEGARVPQQDPRFVVYCEVENFHPVRTKAGLWQTRLTYELALLPDKGGGPSLYTKPLVPVLDACRNRRRDFFIADQVTLPPKVGPGKYVLKVSVTDEQANRSAEATTPLEIK